MRYDGSNRYSDIDDEFSFAQGHLLKLPLRSASADENMILHWLSINLRFRRPIGLSDILGAIADLIVGSAVVAESVQSTLRRKLLGFCEYDVLGLFPILSTQRCNRY